MDGTERFHEGRVSLGIRQQQCGEDVVASPDLLYGIVKVHPTDAEPLQLLDHARVPHRELDAALTDWAKDHGTKDPYAKPRKPATLRELPSLDGEASQVTEISFDLASRTNRAEDGLVRLRDLFGGLLRRCLSLRCRPAHGCCWRWCVAPRRDSSLCLVRVVASHDRRVSPLSRSFLGRHSAITAPSIRNAPPSLKARHEAAAPNGWWSG